MKRLINPTVEELNTMYELARNFKKILIEVMDSTNSGIRGWDYEGNPDENQVIYVVTKRELAVWKHISYEVILDATV